MFQGESPSFEVSWRHNGSSINTKPSKTFETSQYYAAEENIIQGYNIYNYTYKLTIKEFPLRLTGWYACNVNMKVKDFFNPYRTSKSKTAAKRISFSEVNRKPTVMISPLYVSVQDQGNLVIFYCNYTNAFQLLIVFENGTVISRRENIPFSGSLDVRFQALQDASYRCVAISSFVNINATSDLIHVHILKENTITCKENEDSQGMKWESVQAQTTSMKYCPEGYIGVIKRRCYHDGNWGKSNYGNCSRIKLNTIKEEAKNLNADGKEPKSTQIKALSESVNSNIAEPGLICPGDIEAVVVILDEVAIAVTHTNLTNLVDTDTLTNFVNAADIVISEEDDKWEELNIMRDNSGMGAKLVMAIDSICAASLMSDSLQSDPIVKRHVAIKRGRIGDDDIIFPNIEEKPYETYDQWVISSQNKLRLSGKNFGSERDNIYYSAVVFNDLDNKFTVDPQEQEKYLSGAMLKDKQVASDVMAFSLSKPFSLSNPLQLQFNITEENFANPVCAYLDTTVGSTPFWSNKGCSLVSFSDGIVKCHCDHLTNFAILMSPSGTSDEHHEILSIISYIGCGISIVCLIVTLVVHLFVWKYVKDDRSILHMNLSVVLILGYAVFLVGIDQTDEDIVCIAIAALLHYLFLTVFFIMFAEGIQITVSVTFIFSKTSHLKILLFLSYFFPLMIVGVTLFITKTDGYRDEAFCWLSTDYAILWTFAGPALFVILFNIVALLITMRALLNTVSMRAKDKVAKAKASVRALCILSPTFGLTWVFGIFSFNDSLVVFQYLFAIFNTLQGVFIFLLYCLFNKQIKEGLKHRRRKHGLRSFSNGDDAASKAKKFSGSNSNPYQPSSDDYEDIQTSSTQQMKSISMSSTRKISADSNSNSNEFANYNRAYMDDLNDRLAHIHPLRHTQYMHDTYDPFNRYPKPKF